MTQPCRVRSAMIRKSQYVFLRSIDDPDDLQGKRPCWSSLLNSSRSAEMCGGFTLAFFHSFYKWMYLIHHQWDFQTIQPNKQTLTYSLTHTYINIYIYYTFYTMSIFFAVMAGFGIYQPKEYIAELSGDVDHMPSVIPRIPNDHWMKTEIRLQIFRYFLV